MMLFFFFKQKTAYEIYQCDWSSDVCSSDLLAVAFVSVWELTESYHFSRLYSFFSGNRDLAEAGDRKSVV